MDVASRVGPHPTKKWQVDNYGNKQFDDKQGGAAPSKTGYSAQHQLRGGREQEASNTYREQDNEEEIGKEGEEGNAEEEERSKGNLVGGSSNPQAATPGE